MVKLTPHCIKDFSVVEVFSHLTAEQSNLKSYFEMRNSILHPEIIVKAI
jgi:hypothetical protein